MTPLGKQAFHRFVSYDGFSVYRVSYIVSRRYTKNSQQSDAHNSQVEAGGGGFLHVAPDGDWWTGPELFAAKHLEPDYVRSIPINHPHSIEDIEDWIESMDDEEEQQKILRNIYDTKVMPKIPRSSH